MFFRTSVPLFALRKFLKNFREKRGKRESIAYSIVRGEVWSKTFAPLGEKAGKPEKLEYYGSKQAHTI
jgi:hypothetical protein